MECTQSQHWMHAWLDGELDPPGALQLESHLAGCAACRAALAQLTELRGAVAQQATRHTAPPQLRLRLKAALQQEQEKELAMELERTQTPRQRKEPSSPRRASIFPRWPWAWINLGAAAVSTAAFAVTLALYLAQPSPVDQLDQELVASHFRSLMPDHLTDVASTDQHTVKPWFAGKLDFAPPVTDLAPQGYALIGGRLDYIGQRPVAALAYRHRKHLLNLYVWPTATAHASAQQASARQGYQLLRWSQGGMQYAAISDMAGPDLAQFAQLFNAAVTPAR
ncbi:anti-sigma factor family protein [Rugamonas apoptosis]|uniref:Anti-sigma factor n=1 Tax=Rugamonas apoptosis TaxID=2758570 RepID=A0A7W2FDD0_9BURK|nr:anti-sigma factor [Rugamonas apoptosis]MBA5689645.1 anti-sigma factor [Rugamonas apoptosis]